MTKRWGVSTEGTYLGNCFVKERASMVRVHSSGIKSLHSILSNTKAWTKTADNFYGDEDDTLLEPTPDNPVTLLESGSPKIENISFWKLGWSLWLFGPLILLGTGVIPTLWLPMVNLFEGSSTAGLLALAGLDGIFNLGASIFLLMTDSCAHSWKYFLKNGHRLFHDIPTSYKVWTVLVKIIALLGPLVAYMGSKYGCFGPEPAFLPLAVMMLPYISFLFVHMLAEFLVWKWRSPVWLILPLVYGCYGVLQLSRGLQLGLAFSAPLWTIKGMKCLISWWVLVLSVQLMWISWFVGAQRG
ncbi:hypothetical protein KP509_1Z122300 [Ceratopteris richardii]|nr:hypothetical protein KP509_1Z122300 [Ceratopteris richardii]